MNWEESSLGERIAHMCEVRGITPTDLSNRSGISRPQVYRYQANTDHVAGSPENMVKLADAAGVSVEWLTYGRGSIEPREPPRLRNNARWPAELEKAKRHYPSMPERYWEELAEALDTGRPLTWEYIGRTALVLYDLDMREDQVDLAEEQRKLDEQQRKLEEEQRTLGEKLREIEAEKQRLQAKQRVQEPERPEDARPVEKKRGRKGDETP